MNCSNHSSTARFAHYVHFACIILAMARCATAAPPNFVLIVADDLGYGDLGCYGNMRNRTPHLDRLAQSGLRFTDFHSNGAMCSPTRAALMTGRYQQRVGIERPLDEDEQGLPTETVTIAERLRDAGYATAIFGKWHLGTIANGPTLHGFDQYIGHTTGDSDYFSRISRAGQPDWWRQTTPLSVKGYNTDLLTEHAIEFIESHRDRPFFLYLPHTAIHFPWQAPSDTDPATHRQVGLGASSPGLTKLGHHRNTTRAVRSMIESLDQNVGRLIETLQRLQLRENTLVLFTSDNGGYISYHGLHHGQISANDPLRGEKADLYEGGHRVPAIASWPGMIGARRVTQETATSMDVMPTLLSLANADTQSDSQTMDGIDLRDLLLKDQPLPERVLFWRDEDAQAARLGSWKLVQTADAKRLYNLDHDLGEQHDCSAVYPEIVKRLDSELNKWNAEVGGQR
ncbi:MAG: sulfatase [Planctomycetales bacterium]|nr:sulfatase [Planctomycetales bacterium]